MIEAKGPGVRADAEVALFCRAGLARSMGEQATRQVSAANNRAIDWFFAEEAAASKAREVFDEDRNLRSIDVITVPAIVQ